MLTLHLQVRIYQVVVLHALLVVTLQDSSRIRTFLHLAYLNRDLSILASFFLLLLRVVLHVGSAHYVFEPRVYLSTVLLHDLASHTHRQLFVRFLQERDLRGQLRNLVHEVDVDFIVSF